MRAALFPGQGIGTRELLDALSPGHPFLQAADDVLGYDLLSQVELVERSAELKLPTSVAQPAIFVAAAISWQRAEAAGARFDYLAGHSVGEYAALVGAGSMSVEDGLRVVKVRAEGMHAAGGSKPGGMAAILKLDPEVIAEIASAAHVTVANDNAPGQVVLAGSEDALADAARRARARGGRVVPLEVSGAFHSEAMAPAAGPVREALAAIEVTTPRPPVIANVTARPYRNPAEIRQLLVRQLTERVRFRESLEWLCRQGVREFEDMGPGRVVGGLAQRTLQALEQAARL